MNVEKVIRDILSKVNDSDEGRPLQDATQEELEAGKGITRRRDMTRQEREAHDQRRATTRKKQWRRNKKRKGQKEVETKKVTTARKVAVEAFVLAPLIHILDEVVASQGRRFTKYLGQAEVENIAVDVYNRVAHSVSQSNWDTELLVQGADFLQANGWWEIRPKDHEDDEQTYATVAKYLVVTMVSRSKDAWKEAYRKRPTLMSIEKMDTVMANMHSNADPDMARFKADGGARLVGWNPPSPGSIDWNTLAMAVAAAITERKLDPLAEVLLNDEYLRTDGAFMWTEHSDKVWRACGLPMGLFNKMSKTDKAKAAKKAARNRFTWMPGMMEAAIRELQPDVWETPRGHFESAEVAQVVSEERMAKRAAAALLRVLELA